MFVTAHVPRGCTADLTTCMTDLRFKASHPLVALGLSADASVQGQPSPRPVRGDMGRKLWQKKKNYLYYFLIMGMSYFC